MKTRGLMKVLMKMTYKGHPVLVRQFGTDMYVWDAFYEGEFYSSYILMKPAKGSVKLTTAERDETVKMCYAGAAATIDQLLGIELSDTVQAVVERFEAARKQAKGKLN